MANVVPVIGTVLKWAFEQVGDIIGEVITVIGHLQDGFQTLAKWGIWLWNNALQPTVQFILNGFASLTRGFASFLSALGNVPGFWWAKDAAAKMSGAADQAERIGKNLGKIPENIGVQISMSIVGVQAVKNAINGIGGSMSAKLNAKLDGFPGNARGTDFWRGGLTWVGEEGPELVNLPRGSQVIPSAQSAAIASGGMPSSLTIVDSDGTLIGRMRIEASRTLSSQSREVVWA